MRSEVKILILLSVLLNFLPLANAGTITTNKQTWTTDGINDQVELNQALSEGGDVYLTGKFLIDNAIYIGSDTHFFSDNTAIIEVSPSSSQWFAEPTGIINPKEYPLKNVEISGFKLDGNLDQMNASFANSSKGIHDSERGIRLQGTRTAFMENVSIHNMTIYNTFSDGINIAFCYNAKCYNNLICNCQHESIFFTSTLFSSIYNNEIAGINSDCIRLDNCVNTTVFKNIFYSYTGDNRNGQASHGENGIQIADIGYSHGGGSYKPTSTTNVEVYNNTFASTGLRYIWLDSTGKGVKNVSIHDNKFVDENEIETHGVSAEGIIYTNLPTIVKNNENLGNVTVGVSDVVETPEENLTVTEYMKKHITAILIGLIIIGFIFIIAKAIRDDTSAGVTEEATPVEISVEASDVVETPVFSKHTK